ncbi:hypothetical protein V8E36_007725 [Tilletia maclaganii]
MRFPVHALAQDLSRAAAPPSLGLGTWRAPKGQVGDAVSHAIKTGYRHIDAAYVVPFSVACNEDEVGAAIRKSQIDRKELWLTTKVWNSFHAPEHVEKGVDASLKDLGTDYVDHWPVAFRNPEGKQTRGLTDERTGKMIEDPDLSRDPLATWISPIFNQVEVNLLCPNEELCLACAKLGIQLESYSPLGSAENVKEYLAHPTVLDIAARLHASPAQVLLAWPIARGIISLAKSVNPSRIEENFGAIHVAKILGEDDLRRLLDISRVEHGGRITRTVNPRDGWGVEDDIFEDGIDQSRL